MRDFSLMLYNFPAERLLTTRQRLSPSPVPIYVTRLLPFSTDNLVQINEESDFISFIDYFAYDLGFDHVSDFNEYVTSHDFFVFFKQRFSENIPELVLTLKYLYSAKRTLQGLVADDTIFSFHLPYLAEASLDLECSLVLIKVGYFKQSLQTLRNVIEVTIAHAYFSLKDCDYLDLLKSPDYRLPNLKDMVIFLRTDNLFIGDLEREIFALYKVLSGAVHSEILKLNVSRTYIDAETFKEWHSFFLRTSLIHLRLIIRMIEIGI